MINPEAYINEVLDATWNRHDAQATLNLYAEDAVVTITPPPPGSPGTFKGREEIRKFVAIFIPGFHVSSRNIRQSGDKVMWNAVASADGLRQMGLDLAEITAEAVVQDGKIKSFDVTFTPETVARLQAAQQSGA
jgi:ketosteroid isomerase-like protein